MHRPVGTVLAKLHDPSRFLDGLSHSCPFQDSCTALGISILIRLQSAECLGTTGNFDGGFDCRLLHSDVRVLLGQRHRVACDHMHTCIHLLRIKGNRPIIQNHHTPLHLPQYPCPVWSSQHGASQLVRISGGTANGGSQVGTKHTHSRQHGFPLWKIDWTIWHSKNRRPSSLPQCISFLTSRRHLDHNSCFLRPTHCRIRCVGTILCPSPSALHIFQDLCPGIFCLFPSSSNDIRLSASVTPRA